MFIVPSPDSLSVIDATSVAAFYSDMIDKQQGQFNILLIVIGLIVTFIAGWTWWWNAKGAKAQITEEVQTGLENSKQQLNEEITKQVKEQTDAISASIKKELENTRESISKDNRKMKSNLCRVFACQCSTDKSHFNSATWWIAALDEYVKLEDGRFEQISVDAFVDELDKSLKNEKLAETQIESIPDLKERIKRIPDVFTDQRNKAKNLVKKIEDKAKTDKEKEDK